MLYSILITPLSVEHSETSWRWRNDPRIWDFTRNRPQIDITPEIEKAWIERVLEDQNSRRFAITVDGIYIGNIQLTDIKHKEAQYHIFIGEKDYWGGGIAFCASQQIIRFAKNELGLDKLYLEVNPNHERAIKLYKRLGFAIVSNQIRMELVLNKRPRPLVSIFCMVYNHEDFLIECLNGFIMQKCSFDFEIVVGEDCSTDSSRKILLEYARNYPGKFKLILHEKNVGPFANQLHVYKNCLGKYIAMCEGDDYWSDPLKLQKQVDFLESNPEYSYCFHDSIILNQNTGVSQLRINKKKIDEIVDLKSVIIEKNIATASLLFRNVIDWVNLPDWFIKTPMGDYALVVLLAEKGLGKYFSTAMSVYRIHEGGVWSGNKNLGYHTQSNIAFFLDLKGHFKEKDVNEVIQIRIRKEYRNLALIELRRGVFFSGLKKYIINGGFRIRNFDLKELRKFLGAIKTGLNISR